MAPFGRVLPDLLPSDHARPGRPCPARTPAALDKQISSFKAALKAKTVGISLNCFSYPSYYV